MTTNHQQIDPALMKALNALPASIRERSGKVFYSGKSALSKTSPLYILGLNPGGSPTKQATDTVAHSIATFQANEKAWSSYLDESWKGKDPGTYGMQPRVIHLMNKLHLCPRETPASNVIFVRTSRAHHLREEKNALFDACWPVHQAIISNLGIKVILCFGAEATALLGKKLRADVRPFDEFRESYSNRAWLSQSYRTPDGLIIVKASHPSIANWKAEAADPTDLVRRALQAAGAVT